MPCSLLPPPPLLLPTRAPYRYMREYAGYVLDGEPQVVARVLVVLFFCACALGQTYFGPAFNPLTPAHNVLYRVTGVPQPGALRVPIVAAEDKPKEE